MTGGETEAVMGWSLSVVHGRIRSQPVSPRPREQASPSSQPPHSRAGQQGIPEWWEAGLGRTEGPAAPQGPE